MHASFAAAPRALAGALLAAAIAGCQAAPATSPTQQLTSAPTATASSSPSATATAAASVSQAPLASCNAVATDPKVWASVHNRDQAEYVLTVVGRDGACNWPVKVGANGGVTVPAAVMNRIAVYRRADCSVIGEADVAAGIYDVTIQSGAATITPIATTDAIALGEPAGPPCAPGS
jgi:hypothetical protein